MTNLPDLIREADRREPTTPAWGDADLDTIADAEPETPATWGDELGAEPWPGPDPARPHVEPDPE